MDFIKELREKAHYKAGRICLPEVDDERTIYAVKVLLEENLVKTVCLVGDEEDIQSELTEKKISSDRIIIKDHKKDSNFETYVTQFYEKRKHKGVTLDAARATLQNSLYYASMLLANNEVDAVVAGAQNTTGDVLRAALQGVGLMPGVKTVSSVFIMIVPDCSYGKQGTLVFGDCAVVPDPTAEQLADIAESSARTTEKLLGVEPLVAMLSFSTKGSGEHADVDKVVEACKILRDRNVPFDFDGELQADAALIEAVAKKKAPGSYVAGHANCLIFPTLEAGNIGYKLVQRLAKAEAIGPVIQGLRKPYNDLSRGCSVDDIVNTVCLAILNS